MKEDDFSAWDTSQHWLDWLGDEPQQAVREALAMFLGEQINGCSLKRVKITAPPKYMTGVKGTADSSQMTVSRAGLLMPFEATVTRPPGTTTEEITGIFTWVATNLNDEPRRVDFGFLDLGDDAKTAEEQFPLRMYSEGN